MISLEGVIVSANIINPLNAKCVIFYHKMSESETTSASNWKGLWQDARWEKVTFTFDLPVHFQGRLQVKVEAKEKKWSKWLN